MKYILGIDIGTSNTKAVGYSASGEVLAHANVGYSFESEREGYHEIDPLVLLDAVTKVIAEAAHAAANHELCGVSFSAAMHGLIAVDQTCKPLTRMITWADLRSTNYAERLRNTPQGNKIYERTGTPIHPMSPLCKLMWMKDNAPGIFAAAHKFISIKEFVFYRFFEKFVIDHSIASATGLFDIYNIDWNAEALAMAGITAEKLSQHVSPTHILTGLTNDYQTLLGIDQHTPFVVGGSDGCLAHLGSNALKKGDVSLTIGTSGAVRMMTSKPVYDSRQRIFNYLLMDDLYVAGGPINNGGNVLQWYIRNMAGEESASDEKYDWFVQEAVKTAPGSGGLVFLPYIYGERAPVWDASARGVFYGINGTHTQAHFMRAILEGISFALLGILKTLEEVLEPAGDVYVSGGFINSREWVMLLSEVVEKELKVMAASDASSAGAAILGMLATGLIESLDEASAFFGVPEVFKPVNKDQQAYRENYAVYSQLYDKLKDLNK